MILKMKLSQVPLFNRVSIRSFVGADHSTAQRLEELGFFVGRTLECLQRLPWGGPQIFKVGDCVFSLESRLAELIEVEFGGPSS
jgi:Fe2+ transport system protein FeoA